MKKIVLSLITLFACLDIEAQTITLYKGDTKVAEYTADQVDKVVYGSAQKITSITLNQSEMSLYKGSKRTIVATILPENAGDKTITWTSSNESVATVSEGVVTAIEVGTADIIVSANDGSNVSATCKLTVTDDPSDQYEYVDLGLSVKWAKMNVGAKNVYDYGDYFAWGETSGYNSGKTTFSKETYKYYKSSQNDTIKTKDDDGFDVITIVYHRGYTKYVISSDSLSYGYDGFYDNKTILEATDDAATMNWGNKWRMPTDPEWTELRTKCTWNWATMNGINGYKVTSSNGNYIFLPAAGVCNDNGLLFVGADGDYWSSTLGTGYLYGAYEMDFTSTSVRSYSDYRHYGQSVRPVLAE